MKLFMQRLLSVLPRIYFRALRARALPNVPKQGEMQGVLGGILVYLIKFRNMKKMIRKFTIGPFQISGLNRRCSLKMSIGNGWRTDDSFSRGAPEIQKFCGSCEGKVKLMTYFIC